MSNRKKYRRNSKKNPWRDTWVDGSRKTFDPRNIAAILLVIIVPVACSFLTVGVLARSGDMYQFNFRSTQAVESSGYAVTQDDVVNLISDYMNGRTDDFVLIEDVEYDPMDVFNDTDREIMALYRRRVNLTLYIGIAALAVTVALMTMLMLWKMHKAFRRAMLWSAVSLAIVQIFQIIAKTVAPVRKVFYGELVGYKLSKYDFLRLLVEDSFAKQLAIFECVFSVVVYLILLYITFRLAGRKRLFKQSAWTEPLS